MHFLTLFVAILAELVAGDRLEYTGITGWTTVCKNTYLEKDVNYVVSMYTSVCSACIHVIKVVTDRLILSSAHTMHVRICG